MENYEKYKNKINNQERNLICIDFQFLLSAYGVVRFI